MDKSKNPTGTSPVLGDASNSIADKQLREAILNLKKPDKFLSLQPIEAELQDLIDLFHTYGTRERVDELKRLKKIDAFNEAYTTDPRPAKLVDIRIKELNREVES